MITAFMLLIAIFFVTLFGMIDAVTNLKPVRMWVVGFAISGTALCMLLDFVVGV